MTLNREKLLDAAWLRFCIHRSVWALPFNIFTRREAVKNMTTAIIEYDRLIYKLEKDRKGM